MSERTLSELVTHSPAGLGKPRSMSKGKGATSRLKPSGKAAKPAVREETPELTETEVEEEEEEDSLGVAESSLGDSGASPSDVTSGRTISRAANVPFPGHRLLQAHKCSRSAGIGNDKYMSWRDEDILI